MSMVTAQRDSAFTVLRYDSQTDRYGVAGRLLLSSPVTRRMSMELMGSFRER